MDADERRLRMDQLTEAIIGCAHTVGNALGCGSLEKVYENALAHELRKKGFEVQQQHLITVRYDGAVVGEFAADLLVESQILVELKAAKAPSDVHAAQCQNFLQATGLHVSVC